MVVSTFLSIEQSGEFLKIMLVSENYTLDKLNHSLWGMFSMGYFFKASPRKFWFTMIVLVFSGCLNKNTTDWVV
jgi:hypothetical protein